MTFCVSVLEQGMGSLPLELICLITEVPLKRYESCCFCRTNLFSDDVRKVLTINLQILNVYTPLVRGIVGA